ncbi:hypothetical protein [Virgisporangium aliadipatigenens]|uniref:hypothetical protein n=1 Tax=Virgisporangium aliadipatigenens TaxID=741659 RepID=UPI0019413FBF|nr:hypothetical protein [Virgisporangium aliadipatigenens]
MPGFALHDELELLVGGRSAPGGAHGDLDARGVPRHERRRDRLLADVRAAAQEPVAPTLLRRTCAC